MAIMRDEIDGDAFVHLLRRAATRFGWALHAYCLMTNHFHLVVEGETDRLSAGMQALNWTFARRFNARYCRTGHVFEGRFRTRSVLDDPGARRGDHPLSARRRADTRTMRRSAARPTIVLGSIGVATWLLLWATGSVLLYDAIAVAAAAAFAVGVWRNRPERGS